MKTGERNSNYDSYTVYTTPTSKINPLIANIFLLIVVSFATVESRLVNLLTVFLLSTVTSFILSRKIVQILKAMLIVTPFSIGLGLFYSIFGNIELMKALLTIMLRVQILTAASTILYYCIDPWELSSILIDKLRIPPYFSYTIALAIVMYQQLIKDLKQIIDSLKSKGIIRDQLDYVAKIHKILYILVYHAALRTEQVEITLQARNFDPSIRKTRKYLKIRFWEILFIITTIVIIVMVELYLR